MFKEKILESLVHILPPIICVYPPNRKTRFLLHKCLKDSKWIKVRLALQKVHPCAFGEVINECKNISSTRKRRSGKWHKVTTNQLQRHQSMSGSSMWKRIPMLLAKCTTLENTICIGNLGKPKKKCLCAHLLKIFVIDMAKMLMPKSSYWIYMCNKTWTCIIKRLKSIKYVEVRCQVNTSSSHNHLKIM